jgi:NitT/TauT family transport system permease protein
MKLNRLIWSIVSPGVIFLVWEILVHAGVLNPLFFPPPSMLASTAVAMIADGELPARVGVTLRRAAIGFSIGAVLGLLAGLLMGGVRTIRRAAEPLISALNSTPKLTLLPLLMLLVGVGEPARITLVALAAFVVLAIHGLDSVRSISPTYVEMAVNHGAGRLDLFRRIYLPASLPGVFTGVRVAMGRALVITLSAELVGAADGMGGLIWLAWQTFATERLFVGVFTASLLGVVLHVVAEVLEARLIPWRPHGHHA